MSTKLIQSAVKFFSDIILNPNIGCVAFWVGVPSVIKGSWDD